MFKQTFEKTEGKSRMDNLKTLKALGAYTTQDEDKPQHNTEN